MTNEEKAREIVEQYETKYNDTRDLLWEDLEDIALEAMEWKDKQHEQEKQRWIDKAVEWVKNNVDKYLYNDGKYDEYVPRCGDMMFEHLKEVMKGV